MPRHYHSESGVSPEAVMDAKNGRSYEGVGRRSQRKVAASARPFGRSTRSRGNQVSPDASSDEEEESNGDNEDNSDEQDDELDDADEPDGRAPSVEAGSVLSTDNDTSNDIDSSIHRTGQKISADDAAKNQQAGSESMLQGGDAAEATSGAFPRKPSTRRLSNNHGFLSYDDMLGNVSNVDESVIIDSDDDDYTGVNDIYDSDTDDTKMRELETEAIVGLDGDSNADEQGSILDTDFSATAPESASYFEEQMARLPEDHSMFLLDVIAGSPERNLSTRKVRFAESTVVHSSSSSDTSEETVDLPDIFTQTSVNLQGLSNLDNDANSPGSYANSEDGSFWDWTEDEVSKYSSPNGSFIANSSTYPLLPALETEDDMETDEGSSSGYDSDASGETTDEEMPPPPKAPITPRATLRSYKPPTSKKPSFKHAGRPLRSFPIMGSFAVEKDKAIVLTRKYGTVILRRGDPRHTRLVEQSESASTAQSSPTTPFQSFNNADDSDYSEVSRTPITGSMDVMFGGIFGGASNQTYNFGGQVIGPPEAFYPFKLVGDDGRVVDTDDGNYDEDDDDEDDDLEDQLDISNFIKGLSDNEDNGDDDTDMGMSYFDESESDAPFGLQSPAPTDTSSFFESSTFPSQNLYDHFSSPGLVNSFRRQQDRATRLQRLPHDPAQRSAASRPLRSGYNANSLITPSRRRKPSHGEAMQGSFSSPVKSKIHKNRVMGPPPRPRLPKRGFF